MSHSYQFSHAITRKPSPEVVAGLRAVDIGAPDFALMLQHHSDYIAALRASGAEVIELDPLPAYPDSVFVEDTALCLPEGAVIMRPGAPSRLGEAAEMAPHLARLYRQTVQISGADSFIEGGDILVTGHEVLVGRSARTNAAGIAELAELISPWGHRLREVITPKGVLHFKTDCSLLDADTVLATRRLAASGCFEGYRVIEVQSGEKARDEDKYLNRRAEMWGETLDQVAEVWHALKADGFDLSLLNIGGGFPAFYGQELDAPQTYASEVMRQIHVKFGEIPSIMAEPGRGLVAEAGAIAAEVLLVSRKSDSELHRWVYLDIGKFSGLAETMDEAIRYQFITDRDHEPTGACILAGPSCDSADVLYEKQPVQLPLGLQSGDRIVIRNCGAYTSTYASVGFNGFPPLDVIAI